MELYLFLKSAAIGPAPQIVPKKRSVICGTVTVGAAKTVHSMVQKVCPHVSVVLGDVIDIGEGDCAS
jgi:hypothetical protein